MSDGRQPNTGSGQLATNDRRVSPAPAVGSRPGPNAVAAIGWLVLALAMAVFMGQVTWLLAGGAPVGGDSRLRDGGDSFGHWYALQALRAGHDPYGPDVTTATQLAIWGAEAPPGVQAFAYPLPALIWYTPLAWLPFEATAGYARGLGLLGLGVSVGLLVQVANWGRRPWTIVAAIGLLGSLGGVYDQFLLGQSAAVALAAALSVVVLYQRGRLVAAGLLLPLLAIKPQYVLLLGCCLGLHALASPTRRGFLGGGAIALGIAIAVTWWLTPGWPVAWWRNVQLYQYQVPLLGVMTGDAPLLMWAARLLLIGVPLGWWWQRRHAPASERWFLVACAGALACGTVAFAGNPSLYNVILVWPLLALMLFDRLPSPRSIAAVVVTVTRVLAVGVPATAGGVVVAAAALPDARGPWLAGATTIVILLGLVLGVVAAVGVVSHWLVTLLRTRAAHQDRMAAGQ